MVIRCRAARPCWRRWPQIKYRTIEHSRTLSVSHQNLQVDLSERLHKTRNIGIIAHIDAGKTTTTERMLFYSGFTRRIGDVDDGSTVTDFLPAERARGITIQSAAITFHWPPNDGQGHSNAARDSCMPSHTLNLIDTPGHADFTFEVIRSLRVLDGAVCILDGVAGVEAQTEKVWHQASAQRIPRLVFVNKLDRDGAAFHRTVKEIASRLHTWPILCQIPWWNDGEFVGIGDCINYRGLLWKKGGDGSSFEVWSIDNLREKHPTFAEELLKARTAMIEGLTEHDEVLVEQFLESEEDWEGLKPQHLLSSLRRILLAGDQKIAPVFAGASFRNIGVQPLLDAVNDLLPAPPETIDPSISLGGNVTGLRELLAGNVAASITSQPAKGIKKDPASSTVNTKNLQGLALAFKVVSDPRRGVLVYFRVYSGNLSKNALLYNVNLATSERAHRLLRMYASEAVEIDNIEEGQIGVIAGLKQARTGDTIMVYQGLSPKNGPPSPLNTLQLQPISVPPPLFFASVEPNSLAEEKHLEEALALLLREDPSLSISHDPESGQTHLAGMGELHLEIARDRLLGDFKVKAQVGKIEISYREAVSTAGGPTDEVFEREIAGKQTFAGSRVSVAPVGDADYAIQQYSSKTEQAFKLPDDNVLVIKHPQYQQSGKAETGAVALPASLSFRAILSAIQSGVTAAIARGPTHNFPIHSTQITVDFDSSTALNAMSTPAALTAATRAATYAALRQSAKAQPPSLMEPVMVADIAVTEDTLGSVVHDLTAARGAQVLSLDAEPDSESTQAGVAGTAGREELESRRLTPAQVDRVYAPPDPFGGDARSGGEDDSKIPRLIRARVPLKEMVGYLKHLRSLTGGRGTFVMSVDRFERMTAPRMKAAMAEMRGDI